jgi:hypothetical protein
MKPVDGCDLPPTMLTAKTRSLCFMPGSVFVSEKCTGHEWLRWGIAVLQIFEDRAAERILSLYRYVREEVPVTREIETGQSAFEIGEAFNTAAN